jgi:hypothetical protein
MDERDWLAQRFQEHRFLLRAVAYRLLGSTSEADDAIQEAWSSGRRVEGCRKSMELDAHSYHQNGSGRSCRPGDGYM